ncbi:sulfite oxidase heme-binding subunit YedZ [Methylopila turkensis]|uniref:Protein-methionine-sulfoxide reductase heme-binding subunit MsrQ n=1 Tax=Methylopila turkensis TaxID=1437816 RepID=A0A9W6JR60_9HYPH|nr:ferric reductase-like transmembrane domain-containing protein [Methylopila turkensis]GLK80864.1 hypothetical protein GCM10008174_26050 [Methylopila turkensis]
MPLFSDRSGRFSPLLTLTLVGLVLPAAWLAMRAANGDFSGPAPAPFGLPPGFAPQGETPFGPAAGAASAFAGPGGEAARPIYDAIHLTGDWAVRFLMLSLAITPFRRLWHWPRLHLVRRRIGLAALAYAALHLGLYVADQQFDVARVAGEIALRVYLAIGFVALMGLVALGATSTDAAVRRMGAKRWGRLHKLAYAIAGLGVLHFAMQSKLDVGEPMLMWGLFVWAMGWRWLQARSSESAVDWRWLLGLALTATLATAASEALWYGLATGVNPWRVLAANLMPAYGVRPAGWVLLFGLAATLSSLIGARRRGPDRPRAPSLTPVAKGGRA